jgi:hypothetical protein
MDDVTVTGTIAGRYRELVRAFGAAREQVEPHPDRAAA